MTHPSDADSVFISAVGDSLAAEALEERRRLLLEKEGLSARLELAHRRVRAAYASQPPRPGAGDRDPAVAWIHSGRALDSIKRRLRGAAGDRAELMALVADVRREKERRTEMALEFYAARTARLMGGDS